mgnify:CR=1 FL=1
MYFIYSGENPFENSDLNLKLSIDDFIYESIFVNSINLTKYPSIKREFFLDKNDDYETITFFTNEIDVILENLNNLRTSAVPITFSSNSESSIPIKACSISSTNL